MGHILQERIGAARRLPPGEELAVALGVAAADLGSLTEAVLRPHQLNTTRWAALRMLRSAGEHGLPHSVIGERLLVGSPDVTRLMDRMVEAGWVARGRLERDRRVVIHRLTEAGKKRLDKVEAPLAAVHESLVGALGRDEVARLVDACEKVIDAVRTGTISAPGSPDGSDER